MIEWVMLDTQNNEYITVKQARKKNMHTNCKVDQKMEILFLPPNSPDQYKCTSKQFKILWGFSRNSSHLKESYVYY